MTEERMLPPAVLALISDSVHSLEELELLLLLRGAAPRAFGIAQLSERLRSPEEMVVVALQALIVGGLVLQADAESAPRYRYGPRSAELRRTVDELAAIHLLQRGEVLMLISSQAIQRVRKGALKTFSGVFGLPRVKKNG